MMRGDPFRPSTGRLSETYGSEKSREVAVKCARFSEVFIETPDHARLYSGLDSLRLLGLESAGHPHRALRCLAPAATGKTSVATRYLNRVNDESSREDGRLPVLYVSLQNASTSRKLTVSMLEAVGCSAPTRGPEHNLKQRLIRLLRERRVELIILDEIHHLAPRRNVSEVVNVLKAFLNERVCPIAVLGTREAEPLLVGNPELVQRISTVADIHPLRNNSEGRHNMGRFLGKLDQELQRLGIFGESSDFVDESAVVPQMRVSAGVMGGAVRLLQSALEGAIRRDASRIEIYDVARAVDNWAIPQGVCKANPFTGA